MTEETKNCPQCAKTIESAAKVCSFCGYRFASESMVEQVGSEDFSDFEKKIALQVDAKQRAATKNSHVGCLLFAIIGIGFIAWLLIGAGDDNEAEERWEKLAESQERASVPVIVRLSDEQVQSCANNLRAVESGGIIVEWSGNTIRMNPAIFANLKQAEQVGILNGISCAHHGLKLTDLRGQQIVKIVDFANGKSLLFGSDGSYYRP